MNNFINRQDALKGFAKYSDGWCYINALPSAQPEQRWIPCSERLPEKWGDYLVTMKWKGVGFGEVYIETNMAVYDNRAKEWDCTDVIAWMPLPKPARLEE